MVSSRIFDETLRGSEPANLRIPPWFQITSRFLLLIAAGLLLLSLGTRVYASDLLVGAFATVLVAQAGAGFLYAYVWFKERKGAHDTKCELDSIYRHVLDGILLLDDRAICLDANPAAFAILGAPPAVMVGHSFSQFFPDAGKFEAEWRRFRDQSFQHGQTELVRHNGLKLVVNFTLTANYLPGRHAMILCDITERVQAQHSAREMQSLYQQMADSIDEIFWLLDASTMEIIAVNRAYETVTGRSLETNNQTHPTHENLIHPGDRARVLAKLAMAAHSGRFDEEFRIVRPDGEIHWIWSKGFRVSPSDRPVQHLYGTALDITAKKLAEAQVTEHLAAAEMARSEAERAGAEAEALRKATLALTQNLRMDAVLDTLLETLSGIVTYDTATVILTEEEDRLFVARMRSGLTEPGSVVTMDAKENPFFQRALVLRRPIYVPDTDETADWREHKVLAGIRSWIGLPLIVSESVVGVLSVGSRQPRAFTMQHFHLAKLFAIPAAVAIHNARLYEWAQIYAVERRSLLKKLDSAGDRNADRPRGQAPN